METGKMIKHLIMKPSQGLLRLRYL